MENKSQIKKRQNKLFPLQIQAMNEKIVKVSLADTDGQLNFKQIDLETLRPAEYFQRSVL